MSVLIKGMEMPKIGEYRCVIRKWGEEITIDLYGEEELCGTLLPVPDHGRLIDADALCKTLRSLAENEYTPEVFANWIENHIDTIFEAEEGE